MTEPIPSDTPDSYGQDPTVPVEKAALWEDFIDIFYAPSRVYARRRNASFWPPLLVAVVLIAALTFLTYPAAAPAYQAEFDRRAEALIAQNPQMDPAMAQNITSFGGASIRYGAGFFALIAILGIGVIVWLIGKVFGSPLTIGQGILIAAYASMVDVLGTVITGVIALLADPAALTSIHQLTLSPARFVDVDTAHPVLTLLLSRLGVVTIWYTVLLGIGLHVVGGLSKGKAAAAAITWWVLALLYNLSDAVSTARARA